MLGALRRRSPSTATKPAQVRSIPLSQPHTLKGKQTRKESSGRPMHLTWSHALGWTWCQSRRWPCACVAAVHTTSRPRDQEPVQLSWVLRIPPHPVTSGFVWDSISTVINLEPYVYVENKKARLCTALNMANERKQCSLCTRFGFQDPSSIHPFVLPPIATVVHQTERPLQPPRTWCNTNGRCWREPSGQPCRCGTSRAKAMAN